MAEIPEGPTGVSVTYADGAVFSNLPTIYDHLDEDGVHVFMVLMPRDPETDKPVQIGVETFPGLTGLSFAFNVAGGLHGFAEDVEGYCAVCGETEGHPLHLPRIDL